MSTRLLQIAVLLEGLEPVFLSAKNQQSLFMIVLEGSLWHKYALSTFASEKIISIASRTSSRVPFEYDDIIQKTNLAQQLKARMIRHFIVPHQYTPIIYKWVRENKLTAIATPYGLQRKFENKPLFQKWLAANKISTPISLRVNDLIKEYGTQHTYVAQREIGDSRLYTTKYYSNVIRLIRATKNIPARKLLIRRYQSGLSLGVSIFLDRDGNFFYSALRLQGFIYNKQGFPETFLGIQWLPTKLFSHRELQNIQKTLKKLTLALHKEKFIGVANIDFVLSQEKVFVLECNPRLSSAMPQVFSKAGLTSVKDPWQFYLNSLLNVKNDAIKCAEIPAYNFHGSTMEVVFNKITSRLPKKLLVPGVYKIQSGNIKFITGDVEKMRNQKNYFFAICEVISSAKNKKGIIFINIVSNFALFDQKTGQLNYTGQKLYNYFNNTAI